MKKYIGYGINAEGISRHGLLRFMKEYAPKDCQGIADWAVMNDLAKDQAEAEDWDDDLVEDHIEDYVGAMLADSVADYIAKVVCEKTCDGLFKACDWRFVVYPPVRFPDDVTDEMRRFVRNADDVHDVISSFFPDEALTFDSVYEGTEYDEDIYHMGERSRK